MSETVSQRMSALSVNPPAPLRHVVDAEWKDIAEHLKDLLTAAEAERDKYKTALQRIVDEANSDDGLTAWDGGDIAAAAIRSAP